MKMITEVEFERLSAARTILDATDIEAAALALVAEAAKRGQLLTIEQRPLQPLAMWNVETVVRVRAGKPL